MEEFFLRTMEDGAFVLYGIFVAPLLMGALGTIASLTTFYSATTFIFQAHLDADFCLYPNSRSGYGGLALHSLFLGDNWARLAFILEASEVLYTLVI